MRDNAIILSVEHVRLIITADKVLIPREGYEHNPLRQASQLVAGSAGSAGCPALPGSRPAPPAA